MKKRKYRFKWLAAAAGAVVLLGLSLCYALQLIIPSQAADRAAVTAGGGSTIHIDGFDIWYALYNADSEKTPIIVAAGGCGLSSDYMEESMLFLADTHPVLFYDIRGCGRSQIKPELTNYSIEIFADEIESLRKTFFEGRAIIAAAHSFGGIIAMQYAVSYPENLEKLMLISSVSANYKPVMNDSYLKTGLPPRNQLEANKWYIENIDVFLEPYFQNNAVKSILNNTEASYAVMMHVGRAEPDLAKEVGNIDVPVLILAGGEKEYPLTGINVARELEELFPNARMEQFVHSGHFLFAEENEEFQNSVNRFVNDGLHTIS